MRNAAAQSEIIVPTMEEYPTENATQEVLQKVRESFFSKQRLTQMGTNLIGFSLKASFAALCVGQSFYYFTQTPQMFYLSCYEGNYKDFAYSHGIKSLFYRAFPEVLEGDGPQALSSPLPSSPQSPSPFSSSLSDEQTVPVSIPPTDKIPLALQLNRITTVIDANGYPETLFEPIIENYQAMITRQSFEWLRLRAKIDLALSRIDNSLDILDGIETAAIRSSLVQQKIIKSNLNLGDAQSTTDSQSTPASIPTQSQIATHYAREALLSLRYHLSQISVSSDEEVAATLLDYSRYDFSKPLPVFEFSQPLAWFYLPDPEEITDTRKMMMRLKAIAGLTVTTKALLQSARLAILFTQSITNKDWVASTPDYLQSLPNLMALLSPVGSLPAQLEPTTTTATTNNTQINTDLDSTPPTVSWPVDPHSFTPRSSSFSPSDHSNATALPYVFEEQFLATPCAVITAWTPPPNTDRTASASLASSPLASQSELQDMGLDELSLTPPARSEVINITTLMQEIPQSELIAALNQHHSYHNNEQTLIFNPSLMKRSHVPQGLRVKSFKGFSPAQLPQLDDATTQLARTYVIREAKVTGSTMEVAFAKRQQEIEAKLIKESKRIMPYNEAQYQNRLSQHHNRATDEPEEQSADRFDPTLPDPRLISMSLLNPHNIPIVFRAAHNTNDGNKTLLTGDDLAMASARLYRQFDADREDIEGFVATIQPGEVLLIEVADNDGFVFDAMEGYKHQRGDFALN